MIPHTLVTKSPCGADRQAEGNLSDMLVIVYHSVWPADGIVAGYRCEDRWYPIFFGGRGLCVLGVGGRGGGVNFIIIIFSLFFFLTYILFVLL